MMLKGSLSKLFQSVINNNIRLFSLHHEPVPTKLPKVNEITYVPINSVSIFT
jgi:hypothetical protein